MNSVWDDPFMRHFVKSPESIVASHPTLALMINPTPSCTAITRRTSLNHTLNALSDKPVNDMNHVWEDPSMRQFLKPTDTNSPSLQVNPTHNNANNTSLSLCHQQEPVESSVPETNPVESRLSPVAIKHQVSPIFKRKNPSPHLRKSPQGLGSALHSPYLMPSEPQQHASKVEPENTDIEEKEQLVQSGYQKMVNFYETPVPLASYAYTPPYPRRLLVWPNQPKKEQL
uniref:Uncharacterized protein n=1 Tax=Ciona savignyi TaxID=51511 RepID=H2YJ17_CIOSA